MARIFFIVGLLLAGLLASAQNSEFEDDIKKFLAINGSTAAYDMVFDQMVAQFKMMKTEAPDEVWKAIRTDVFDKEIKALNTLMIPIYKNHYSHDDIKAFIAFYESPAGKKLTGAMSQITQESMQLSQTWAMGLGQKINEYLQKKGY